VGQEQLLNILDHYFHNAAKYHPEPDDAGKTTYFSRVGKDFLIRSAQALHKLQPTSPHFSQHTNLLQSLMTSLQDLHDDLAAHPPPDYLFFASFIYVFWFLCSGPDDEILKTDIGQDLILTILQYREYVALLRKDIEEGFYDIFGFSFAHDWLEFVERARKLGIQLPTSAVQLATNSPPLGGIGILEESRQLSSDTIVDIRGEEWYLQDDVSAHSSWEMDGDNATNLRVWIPAE